MQEMLSSTCAVAVTHAFFQQDTVHLQDNHRDTLQMSEGKMIYD